MAVPIDPSNGFDQEFIEDCSVCCKPISIRMKWGDDDEPVVEVERS